MTRHILITGVSRGLGLALAQKLLDAGDTVSGLSRHLSADYETLQKKHGKRARFKAFDLKQASHIKSEVFDDFLPFDLPLHGFVNNAAVAYDDLVTNLDLDRFRAMNEVNVLAPITLTQHAIRHMLFNRVAGSIVHISSVCAHTGYKGLAMYAATKGALEAFSKNTAREWGERGIRSNCVVAGFMETDMSASLSDEQGKRIHSRTALKKATEIESVAAAVVYFLKDGSSSITGQNLFVDSGTI